MDNGNMVNGTSYIDQSEQTRQTELHFFTENDSFYQSDLTRLGQSTKSSNKKMKKVRGSIRSVEDMEPARSCCGAIG